MKGLLVAASIWGILVRAAEVIPAAVAVDPSQYWDGDDGPWSSFPIRVGTPAQDLRVLISTAATSTWVIQAPLGCEGYTGADCANARGGNFTNATSSTWKDKGTYNLFIEENLGYYDSGDYGFDTVGLGWQGTGVTLNSSLVTLITTPDWEVGVLGLNYRPTNFTTFNDRATSLLTLLYDQNMIPSLSYSYTAGAKYRLNEVLGSLTLGGYDDSLYEPNNLTFGFYFDQTRDLTVGLQAITSTTSSGNTSLLPTPGLFLIDSTISQNYLPQDACAAFEKAFNLTLDKSGYYLVNDTQHANLLAKNPNITFTIGAQATGGQTVDITFPYAAFDLNLSYPIQTNVTRYFPIIPATNSTQFTLGRQFLQEAYITVDYLRANFSVYQRKWSLNAQSHIVSITPPANSTETSTPGATGTGSSTNGNKSSGIGTGAIVGIVVGVIAILVIIGGFIFWRRHKKRKAAETEAAAIAAAIENEPKDAPLVPDPYAVASPGITELGSPEVKPPELHAEHYFAGAEMDSSQVVPTPEMEGDRVFYELEAPHGMHEMTTQPLNPTERQRSDASTPTWKSRSPIRHPSDGGG